MTWDELALAIGQMTSVQRSRQVLLLTDLDSDELGVTKLELAIATQEIWHGISIGNELVITKGDLYMREA